MKATWKKLISLFLAVAALFSFAACKPEAQTDLKVFVPDGAPALALAQLMSENKQFDVANVSYHIVTGDQIAAKVSSQEADIAILPTNAAATLYAKGVDIKLVSSNVFGLLYLMGSKNVTSLAELKGEIVYNIGQGNTPDITFQYILEKNGIEFEISDKPVEGKVALQYVSDGSELIPLLKQGKATFGILGEPAATNAMKVASVSRLFDIQEEWKKVTGSKESFPQASLVIKGSLLESHPKFVKEFLAAVEKSASWLPENAEAAGTALKNNGSLLNTALFTEDVISRCNVRFVGAKEAKAEVMTYLNVLYEFNAKSVGGKLPDDAFFYLGK